MAVNTDTGAAFYIEQLLFYALDKRLITEMDLIPTRNALLDLLQLSLPYGGCANRTEDNLPSILDKLLDYATSRGLIGNSRTEREMISTRIMGLLTPRASEIVWQFDEIRANRGVQAATDWFYELCVAVNYVDLYGAQRNLIWKAPTEYGPLVITINLAKPEKDPREIERSRDLQPSSYPRCLLCIENVGFAGNVNHPARQNLRVIPVLLDGEEWFLQYSPYSYYNEHCILVYKQHVPMQITSATFVRLLEFVDQFPHYFMGSNADLPIVGGSILSHEHYQGGRYLFPMDDAAGENRYVDPTVPVVTVETLKWPLSVVRLTSKNRQAIVEVASKILSTWRRYDDPGLGILSLTERNGQADVHNTITPVARKLADGTYRLDVVLRNNRTDDEHPWGIFHPHQELHHIKKENIGLIEVMGLAILPGRLKAELEGIVHILTGSQPFEPEHWGVDHMLAKHAHWIQKLLAKYGTNMSEQQAWDALREEVGFKFLQVLVDCGVFKRDAQGEAGFDRFLKTVGLERL